MTRILAFSGRKQSGKTTCSNFVHGYQLRAFRIIDNFAITEGGELLITTEEEPDSYGMLDIRRLDRPFSEWASYNMWPYIKNYSLATPLKLLSVELFGLSEDQVFGTDAQKNSKTAFKWEDMPKPCNKRKAKKKMTAREFLQFFGTEVCRKINEDVWIDRLIKDIELDSSLLAVVDDVRFENEVEAVQAAGGKVIRLTRGNYSDNHSSECSLDSFENFDATIDNKNLDINQTNQEIIKLLEEWEWLGEEVPQEKELAQLGPETGIHTIKA